MDAGKPILTQVGVDQYREAQHSIQKANEVIEQNAGVLRDYSPNNPTLEQYNAALAKTNAAKDVIFQSQRVIERYDAGTADARKTQAETEASQRSQEMSNDFNWFVFTAVPFVIGVLLVIWAVKHAWEHIDLSCKAYQSFKTQKLAWRTQEKKLRADLARLVTMSDPAAVAKDAELQAHLVMYPDAPGLAFWDSRPLRR